MRTVTYRAGVAPRERGRAHGESFRGEIQTLAELRYFLTARVGGIQRADAERIARLHLPVLERFDAALADELAGIAEGAAVPPEHIVVLNHYTDLRDIDPRFPGGPPLGDERTDGGPRGSSEGCSALWTRTPAGPVVAQTWDMHASAMPYVMRLDVEADETGPAATLLSLTGCLGMCGMNQDGVAMAINNLTSNDARVGIVWPALVRRGLRERRAAAARDVVMAAPLGSGHHYLIADPDAAYGVETSGTRRQLAFAAEPVGAGGGAGPTLYVHTNHCLDPEVASRSRVPPGSTTFERYDRLRADLEATPAADADDAYRRLGSHEGYPRSVCANLATPEQPHQMATCAAIAMDLTRREVLMVQGFPHNVAPERATVGPTAAVRA